MSTTMSAFARVEQLLNDGLTMTQIKSLIERKAATMPEGPAKLELRRAWAHVHALQNPNSNTGQSATTLITNHKSADRAEAEVTVTKAAPLGVREGLFTVVCADNTHRTIRLRLHWDADEAAKGTLVAYFLMSADNDSEKSYKGFAFVSKAGKVIIWKRFRTGFNAVTSALHFLVQSGDYTEAGMRYAMESGKCCKCNRTLTVPASLHRGMGPVCAAGGKD